MSWLLTSLVASAIFLVAIVLIAKCIGNGAAWMFAAFGIFVSLVIPLPMVSLHCFVTFLLAIVWFYARVRPSTVLICGVAAALGTYGFGLGIAYLKVSTVRQLQQEFAATSLEDRLSHEQRELVSVGTGTDPLLSPEVETRLSNLEQEREMGTGREYLLARLHRKNQMEFALTDGFGVTRMSQLIHIHRSALELPEIKPIPLPDPVQEHQYDGADPAPLADQDDLEVVLPVKEELASLHYQGLTDFIDQERMGYVQDRSHVVGFEPHQFRQLPTVEDEDLWRVTRLELISLLRHEQPVAYVSKYLPSMKELQGVPTRALTPFEQSALDRLRSEQDVVIKDGVNQIQMVGSLRAARDCLKCHSVRRGELLGAFSYDIVRVEPLPEPKPVEPQAAIRPWSGWQLAAHSD